jgi:hypothetical protein
MSVTIDRGDTRAGRRGPAPRRHGGPVILATFARTPFGARAVRVAVESAAEMRSTLVIVQMHEARSLRRRARAAEEPLGPALAAAVRAAQAIAAELGVEVESVRVSSPQPVGALLGFVADRRPALVVFATDPAALRRFRRPSRAQYRRFVAALAAHATDCLIWTAQEPGADAATSAPRPAARSTAASVRPRGVRPADALKMKGRPKLPRWLIPAPWPV